MISPDRDETERWSMAGKADGNLQSWSDRTNTLHHLAQKSSSILETSSITADAVLRAEKFVAEVAVTMFDVHEVEAQLPGHHRGTMEVVNDGLYFARPSGRETQQAAPPPIQERVVIENTRLGPAVRIGTAVATRICQLQTDRQAVVGASREPVFLDQCGAQAWTSLLAYAPRP